MTLRTAILAAAFLPTMALAQAADVDGMREGLSMIETEVARALESLDVSVDVRTLTLNQLVEISNALDDEMNRTPADTRAAIEAAVARN